MNERELAMKALIKRVTKYLTLFSAFSLMAVGTYNAVFMNSLKFMSDKDLRFVKRLDEINGRIVAAQAPVKTWTSLKGEEPKRFAPSKVVAKTFKKNIMKISKKLPKVAKRINNTQKAPAVISNDLDLQLAELYNSKKYKKALSTNDFSGELFASNGIIETISVSLPNNEEINISFAEMSGNVFNYDFEGISLSGMMYEVSSGSYMVTLTNGPYAGTRMKFQAESNQDFYDHVEPKPNYGNNNTEYAQNIDYNSQQPAQNNDYQQGYKSNGKGMQEQQQVQPTQGFNFSNNEV
jgi:hypothetical protein